MLRGLYITATGMMTQTRKMDVITNNIVNSETVGYRKDTVVSQSFEDLMLLRLNDPNIISASRAPNVGYQNKGVYVDRLVTDFSKGSVDVTERTSDFVLTEDGFFVIETPQGDRYTRAGNFSVNNFGYLTTADGYMVKDVSGGHILIGSMDFEVDDTGTIKVGGVEKGQIQTVAFDDNLKLRKSGDNLYMNFEDQAVEQEYTGAVKQGYLETSNVDAAREMVEMMTTYRLYEANQRLAKLLDESLGRAVNDIARV